MEGYTAYGMLHKSLLQTLRKQLKRLEQLNSMGALDFQAQMFKDNLERSIAVVRQSIAVAWAAFGTYERELFGQSFVGSWRDL